MTETTDIAALRKRLQTAISQHEMMMDCVVGLARVDPMYQQCIDALDQLEAERQHRAQSDAKIRELEFQWEHRAPTQWAYDQACAALHAQRERAEAAEKSLAEKNERSTACVNAFEGIETDRIKGKTLGEFLAGEVHLNKAEPKSDGGFGFTFSGFAVQLMAESFADQFRESGAINYLELLFEHNEIGPLTVTMQRVEGLTPAQKLAVAEKERDVLKVSHSALRESMSAIYNTILMSNGNVSLSALMSASKNAWEASAPEKGKTNDR